MDFINYKLNNMENNRYLFFIFLIIIVFSLISSVSASNSLDIDNSNYNTILESNQVINSDNNLNNDDSLKLESSDKYEKDILSVSSVHIIPSDTTNDELQYIFDNSKSGDTIQFNDNVYNNISIVVNKIHEGENNTIDLIESGKVSYVISTSAKGRMPTRDSVKIRRKTVEWNIPCLTSIDTANAIAMSLRSKYTESSTEIVDINNLRKEKQHLEFTKMQGCGNDYIYFNCFDKQVDNPEGLAINLSDRHFGIGGDGVILICPSEVADAKMRMFNLDGSEGKMCGNGIRCVAKFMRDNGIVDKDDMTVETLSGIMKISLTRHYGEVNGATVDMGKAILAPQQIPVTLEAGENGAVVDRPVHIIDRDFNITCVSMGNPHAVTFINNVELCHRELRRKRITLKNRIKQITFNDSIKFSSISS